MNHHQSHFGYDRKAWQTVRADKMNTAVNFMLRNGLIRLVTEDEP